MRAAKVAQRWRCDNCGYTYDAPIPAIEVYCPKTHMRKSGRGPATGKARMTLIEGSPVPNRKPPKESPHGKS